LSFLDRLELVFEGLNFSLLFLELLLAFLGLFSEGSLLLLSNDSGGVDGFLGINLLLVGLEGSLLGLDDGLGGKFFLDLVLNGLDGGLSVGNESSRWSQG
jgi:hypothetical protein